MQQQGKEWAKRHRAGKVVVVVGLTLSSLSAATVGTSAAATAPSPSPDGSLAPGEQLGPDQVAVSPNGRYVLRMQADGNLVLIAPGNRPIWASGTDGRPGSVVVMQTDGNLVVLAPGTRPIWASGTVGNPGSVLTVQDDGNLVLVAPGNRPIWATGTTTSTPLAPAPAPAPAAPRDRLLPDQVLGPDQQLVSSDGRYVLKMQGDGNLVLIAPGNRPVRASGTEGNPGAVAKMQADGNMVVIAPGNRPVRATGTNGNPGTVLVVQNDGKAVLYASGNRAIGEAPPLPPPLPTPLPPPPPPVPRDRLLPDQVLGPDQQLVSSDGRYVLKMQGDGNLVLYGPGGSVVWQARTHGSPGSVAVMQADGNLVVYAPGSRAIWSSRTAGSGVVVVVQNDAKFVLYAPGNRALTQFPAPAPPPPPPPPTPGRVAPTPGACTETRVETENEGRGCLTPAETRESAGYFALSALSISPTCAVESFGSIRNLVTKPTFAVPFRLGLEGLQAVTGGDSPCAIAKSLARTSYRLALATSSGTYFRVAVHEVDRGVLLPNPCEVVLTVGSATEKFRYYGLGRCP